MKKATVACVIISFLIFLAVIVTFIQMSYHADKTGYADPHGISASMRHVISLSEADVNLTVSLAERFPYVAAVTRNATTLWTFACFASIILVKWIVTSAHCRIAGHTHRVILYHDFVRNQTHAFPILFWRIHEKYNSSLPNPRYDIAVAKLNVEFYQFQLRPAVFDESRAQEVQASIWKTVSTMDKKLYLTNHFDKYDVKIATPSKCYESYGAEVDDSLICIDSSDFDECFIHEYGPIYSGDKLVGILSVKPVDCDMKLSLFTNVSFYTTWILRTTYDS